MNPDTVPAGAHGRSRVLLIANTGWYLENFRASLVARLEAEGCEVVIAVPPGSRTDAGFFRAHRFEPLAFSRRGRNPVAELSALFGFVRMFRRLRPDLVFTWTPKPNIYGSIAGRWCGVTVVPTVTGLGAVFIRGGILARLVGRLYRFAFRRVPVLFVQNEADQQMLISGGMAREAQIQRLPGSGVDLQRFGLQPLPPMEPFVFLYSGRLLADKGLRELVAAAATLRGTGRRFVLHLAGFLDPGNPAAISETELQGWVAGGVVQYAGFLHDIRPALAQAHCVVLPSYREGIPRSLLEAAATGRPVITTDAPGCRDTVLPGESGFLCKVRDPGSLAACMARMLDLNAETVYRMGLTGRKHVERAFSEEIVLNAYLEQYQRLSRISPVTRSAGR